MARQATNALKVATGLTLDADYIAGASIALLGKRGSGKTYASRVLAEELVGAHVQTIDYPSPGHVAVTDVLFLERGTSHHGPTAAAI